MGIVMLVAWLVIIGCFAVAAIQQVKDSSPSKDTLDSAFYKEMYSERYSSR